jgi:hypothetical protein
MALPALTGPVNSNIILAILATGEAFVVDRRPGQVAKADLRLPIAEEGVSHRCIVVKLITSGLLIKSIESMFSQQHFHRTEVSYSSEALTERL